MGDKMFEFIMTHAWWILVLVLSAAPFFAMHVIVFIIEMLTTIAGKVL